MWPELLLTAVMAGAPPPAADHAARYLALGDSYTIGEGVDEAQRWPLQLARQLKDQGITLDRPQLIARTGWTTDELAQAIAGSELHPPYALVTLLIGVNNQYRGRDPENYRHEFTALLQHAVRLAGDRPQRVLVLSIPDWGVTRFGHASGRDVAQIARELDAYNAINRTLTGQLHARYVDISQAARAGGADPQQLTADGLHPSAAMYAQWTALALPEALAALRTP